MDEIASFGHILRTYRRARDLTQEELARRAYCALATIKKIEADERRPSRELAERFAQVLTVPEADVPAFLRLARGLRPDAARPLPSLASPLTPQEVGTDDLSGREVRGYALCERLGIGGFGAVYRAIQPSIQREVALKIILPRYANQPDFIRRFEAEAQFVARLEHPHIVPLYDYWREPNSACMVMRYMRGGSLAALLRDGPLTPQSTLQVLEQVGAALAVAHRAGVVHRDLKPANVLRDAEGNAYLADFGIAKDLGAVEADGVTQAGAIVGSPDYLSPEQITDEPLTSASDIYSLGVMLYELLTAAKPFQTRTPSELLRLHLSTPLPSLRERRPELPEVFDAVIQFATAKRPADRYPNVASLVLAFREMVNGPAQAIGRLDAEPERDVTIDAERRTVLLDVPVENPYKGLRAFGEADAADFFGREALVVRLLERLAEPGDRSWELGVGDFGEVGSRIPNPQLSTPNSRFLAVVGPSGSGKSSVVRAGLIPALRQGGIPGSEQWFITDFVPGAHPLEELELALLKVAVRQEAGLAEQLGRDKRGLLRAARLILPDDAASELVLIIDQFEEVFTLVEDEAARAHFLDSLVAAATDPRSRVRVVVTLRADFYDRPLRYTELGALLRECTELVLPLTADELEQAIVAPARRAGVLAEPELVANIVHDVGAQPGALPLLQYALTELFEQRTVRMLTRSAYRTSGGLRGALARRAEELYQALDPAGQAAARQLFLRLTTPGEGNEDTRRRTPLAELQGLGDGADAVITAFGAARFLTFDHDPLSRAPTVEVAHEALLREWPRLRGWLDAARADLRLQRRLAQEAAEWEQAGRADDYLASGARLGQYEALAQSEAITLTERERGYLAAALARRDAQATAERERQAHDLAQALALAEEQRQRTEVQRRAAQGLRVLVGALTIFLLVAGGLATFAVSRQREAEANFTRAEAQRLAAEANQIIARRGNSETAALLALRSIRLQYTPQGDEALGGAAGLEFARHILAGHPAGFGYAFWSPDGAAIFSGGADEIIRRWDAATGVEQAQLSFSDVGPIAVAPNGELAVGYGDGAIELRDPSTLQPLGEFATLPGWVNMIAFSADGRQMLVGFNDNAFHLYDIASRRLLLERAHPYPISEASASPDLRTVATTDREGTIRIWSVEDDTITREWQAHGDVVTALDFSPDAQKLLSVSQDRLAKYWDLATGELLYTLSPGNWLWDGDISPDGRWIATVDDTATLVLWDAATGAEVRRYLGQYGTIYDVEFSPDSRSILSVGQDGTVRVYDVAPQSLPQFLDHPFGVLSVAIAPDGSTVATGDRTGVLRMWDAATGKKRWEQPAHERDIIGIIYLHGGAQLLTTSTDDTMRLWDAASGELISSITKNIIAIAPIGFDVSHDERFVVTRSADTTAIWEIATGDLVRQFDKQMANAIFMPDDTAVVTIYSGPPENGIVRIWDVNTGDLIHQFAPVPGQRLWGLAATPDGKQLAVGIVDGVIQLREYGTWREVGQFLGHTDRVHHLVFSPDGRFLLSAGADRTARLWDVATRTELRRYVHEQQLWRSVAFTADGTRVLTAGADGVARLRHVEINDTIADLCSRMQRDFTPEERAQYGIADDGPTCPGQ